MASSLVWMLVKDQNAFLKKQRHSGGAQFSAEPFNLTNKNSYVASGLANDAALDISFEGALRSKDAAATRTPKSTSRDLDSADIANVTSSYRKDLRKAAQARYSKVTRTKRVTVGKRKELQKTRGN